MKVRIQASIRGFHGKPATVYALYDPENDLCIVGKVGVGSAKKQSGGVLVSDTSSSEFPVDDYYLEPDIAPSISDFFLMLNDGKLIVSDKVRVADPSSHLEFDGLKNNKKDYRVMPTISNAQIGVLAIARYINKSKKIEQIIDFANDIGSLREGGVITV